MKPFKQAVTNFGLYPNNNGPGPFKRWLIEWPHSAKETSLKNEESGFNHSWHFIGGLEEFIFNIGSWLEDLNFNRLWRKQPIIDKSSPHTHTRNLNAEEGGLSLCERQSNYVTA